MVITPNITYGIGLIDKLYCKMLDSDELLNVCIIL